VKQYHLRLESDLWKRAKRAAVDLDMSLQQLIVLAIKVWLDRAGK